jgi:tetratricopeptide (TPR) repeat protein
LSALSDLNAKFTTNTFPQQSEDDGGSRDRLDSWKEIATYLRREVRTVQLWEKNEGLPVHRHFHKRLGSVYALRSEIEAWLNHASRNDGDPTPVLNTSLRAENQITICSLPLEVHTMGKVQQGLCEFLVAQTMAALQQTNPGNMRIVIAKPTNNGKQKRSSADADDEAKFDYLLRWSFQDDRDGLHVSVALLSAQSGTTAWAQTSRSAQKDIEEWPRYTANQITQCLWLKAILSTKSASSSCLREKSGAREAYLKGRYFWNQRNEESLRKAIHCFESAVREDPEFALPYSGLADSLTLLSFYGMATPSKVMPAARRAAQKAIELDPNSAEAHASLADVFLHFDRDWDAADSEYRRSIQCNPEYALGYHWYANLLAARGQHEAAHMAIMHALKINPVSIITLVWAGVMSYLAHDFDEAIRHYRNALELDPKFGWAHMYMAQALEQKGDFKMALREFATSARLAGENNSVRAMMAHAHAVAGDIASARGILHGLDRIPSKQCVPSYDIAATYAALGESHQALSWLNRACRERNMKLFTLTHDPRFDRIRHASGFEKIVQEVGLPQGNVLWETHLAAD